MIRERNAFKDRGNLSVKRFILYPHQLFEKTEMLRNYEIILIEEPLFFTLYPFHAQKLVLHRASMKHYFLMLQSRGLCVRYVEVAQAEMFYREGGEVTYYDVADDWLEQKIRISFATVQMVKSPNFLNCNDDAMALHVFYMRRRKEMRLWVEGNKPLGGKWSFDEENRQRLPKLINTPDMVTYDNPFVQEAKQYIQNFPTVGSVESFYYPTTHNEAREVLSHFLQHNFALYGTYQDAIDRSESPLFHSLISAALNIGLLDLEEVIEKALNTSAPFNAKEGFIRQIIGWREFMFSLYKRHSRVQRTSNFFGFDRTLHPMMKNGTSGIVPLDVVNAKILKTSYAHHIERLMVQGNLFLLTETHPDDVYRYFMMHTIDAYDWVMVGNVYGMSQYADGGMITTKPYISSSNYLHKMSYYPKQGWSKLWDSLYWRFMAQHSKLFAANPRMKMQRALMEKMSNSVMQEHKANAEYFLAKLEES